MKVRYNLLTNTYILLKYKINIKSNASKLRQKLNHVHTIILIFIFKYLN